MSLFTWNSLDIEIKFTNEDKRQLVSCQPISSQQATYLAPLYDSQESISGSVTLRPRNERRVEHSGAKVKFIGAVEHIAGEKVVDSTEFISLTHELTGPEELRHAETLPFEFKNVDKPYESYNGMRVRLRYYIQATAFAKVSEPVKERDIWVYQYSSPPSDQHLVTMDVGIESCLHIEFEFAKTHFALDDTLIGRIFFLMVRLKLRLMEISIVRKETSGKAPNLVSESQVITKYEVMDGAPVKGEQIPIRMHLGGFNLIPTMKDVNHKFSVRTYISLVLIDESGRKYFKQAEITLYRTK